MLDVVTKIKEFVEADLEVGTNGDQGTRTVTFIRLRLDTPMTLSADGRELTIIGRGPVMLESLTDSFAFAAKQLKKAVNDGTMILVRAGAQRIAEER